MNQDQGIDNYADANNELSGDELMYDGSLQSSFSSPIRPTTRDHTQNILDKQKERHNALYHPLSSPVKGNSFHRNKVVRLRGAVINPRNKHEKMKEIRGLHKHDVLMNNREKIQNFQSKNDLLNQWNREADELAGEIYINEWLERDQEDNDDNSYKDGGIDEQDILQQELEEFLRAEQEELEQQIENLAI